MGGLQGEGCVRVQDRQARPRQVQVLRVCIFTGATCEELCPSTHSIAVPFVKKSDFQVMGLEGDYLQLMDEDMEMKEDLQLPNVDYKTDDDNKISEQIKSIIEEIDGGAEIELYCTVMQAIGKEKVVEIKKKDAKPL